MVTQGESKMLRKLVRRFHGVYDLDEVSDRRADVIKNPTVRDWARFTRTLALLSALTECVMKNSWYKFEFGILDPRRKTKTTANPRTTNLV